jgi:methionine-rich copper-binding protein CopC
MAISVFKAAPAGAYTIDWACVAIDTKPLRGKMVIE